jgi:predicted nuclease of predicted toxin-antitoxin system
MGISPQTVGFLRELGNDAVHLHEQHLDRLPDPDILAKARREERVLLTHDLDFGDLLAASRSSLPSVVIFRLRDMTPGNVNAYLGQIIKQQSHLLNEGAVISVAEGYIRVRRLPIG